LIRPLAAALCLALVGCDGAPPAPAEPQASNAARRTLVYDCEDLDLVVREGQDDLTLHLPDRTVALPRVAAASGAKYAQGDVVFWSKGDEATLEIGERRYGPCGIAPERAPWEDARLRGVTFRAVGNEPGWFVEIDAARIAFTGDYGDTVVSTPAVAPEVETSGRTTWHATTEAHELEIATEDRSCSDGMSDQEYPLGVTVRLDGKTYQGCGRRLGGP
jgi:putative lipoprotein